MKPDSNVDYYSVLGVEPSASVDDIKKAFRKQALLHHPDRNPGKEEEAKARFQEAHTAWDVLSDKMRREKYDRERQKRNMLWEKQAQQSPAPSPGPGPGPAPATAASAYQQTQGARAPRSATASRYAAFAKPARESFYGADVNARFNAFKAWENMKAGHRPPPDNQQQQSPPKQPPRPAPTAQKTSRTRSDWDEVPSNGRPGPGLSRSQSTRTAAQRGGFNPYSNVGDEPATRRSSAFYNTTRSERAQTAESKFYPPPPAAGVGPRPAYMKAEIPRPNLADTLGETYSSDRLSTPYAKTGGEKTYFSPSGFGRSAKSSNNLEGMGNTDRRKSPGSGRFRSASPKARSPQPAAAGIDEEETSPSESEDEAYTDRMKHSQQDARRASADVHNAPGQFGRGGRHQTWTPRSPTDTGPPNRVYEPPPAKVRNPHGPSPSRPQSFAGPSSGGAYNPRMWNGYGHGAGNQSMPSAAAGVEPGISSQKRPSMYEYPKVPKVPVASFIRRDGAAAQSGLSLIFELAGKQRSWPYWAIPSSVAPVGARVTATPKPSKETIPIPTPVPTLKEESVPATSNLGYGYVYANIFDQPNRFSIPSSGSSSAAPSKRPSTENVNMQFSPTDWHGKFTGATDYMGPHPGVGVGPGPGPGPDARGRTSPPKRSETRPTQTQTPPPPASSNGNGNGDASGAGSAQKMPPPPTVPSGSKPRQSSASASGSNTPSHSQSQGQGTSGTSPPKFSSEEWKKTFKDGGTWFIPGTQPLQTPKPRPIRSMPSSKRGAAAAAAAAADRGRASFTSASEDTGNDGDDEGRQSGSNLDTEGEMSRTTSATAMDIDVETPPGASRNTSAPPATGTGTGTGGGSTTTTTTTPASSSATPTQSHSHSHSHSHSQTRSAGNKTTSPSPGTAFPKPPEPQTGGFNMNQLRNVFPVGAATTSGGGLSGIKADLGSTLPFESGTSSSQTMPGSMPPRAQRLELPQPPKLPLKPSHFTQMACEFYMKKFSVYIREFHAFNARMLEHFNARQQEMVSMTVNSTAAAEKGFVPMCNGAGGGGSSSSTNPSSTNNANGSNGVHGAHGSGLMPDMAQWSWMGARGDDGYLRYVAWLREDDQVQEHWAEAWDVHRRGMRELGEIRRGMKGLAGLK